MFSPDRATARERLQAFLPRAGQDYARQRNYDRGPERRENVSCLSPWLRRRTLLEVEVLRAVLDAQGPENAQKFIDEVYWRAYFRGWMANHDGAWPAYLAELARARESVAATPALEARLFDAEAGRTGNAAFDHWAQELCATGYLHNHARMWFASIWIFTLRLPWVLGADFFLRHLIDGDPASNTLGWRWVGGLHTRGKTYLARRDNILKFTDGRLDPGHDLAREAPPLHEAEPPERTGIRWPEPARAGRTNGWLLTPEDTRAEASRIGPDEPLLGLVPPRPDGLEPVAEAVMAFSRGCVVDALARRGQHDASVLDSVDGNAVCAWAQEHGLDTVHVMHAPYGTVADALDTLEAALAQIGVSLQRHVRRHDAACWPHAGRGFFQLRKRIPALLQDTLHPVDADA